jgi:RecB family exonuclease
MDDKQERQLAFVEALKAVDYEKEYQQALRDIAETVLGVEFDENNEPIVSPNEEYDEER